MEKNSEKKVVVDGLTLKLLRKDEKWVFPFVTYYQHGLGSPICLELLEYKEDSNGFEPEAVITVNLPGVERNAGCQFIDTNNNGEAYTIYSVRHSSSRHVSRQLRYAYRYGRTRH